MWDLPGPRLEPMSPALAGGFLTTVPPGKPRAYILNLSTIPIFSLCIISFFAAIAILIALSVLWCCHTVFSLFLPPCSSLFLPLPLKHTHRHPLLPLPLNYSAWRNQSWTSRRSLFRLHRVTLGAKEATHKHVMTLVQQQEFLLCRWSVEDRYEQGTSPCSSHTAKSWARSINQVKWNHALVNFLLLLMEKSFFLSEKCTKRTQSQGCLRPGLSSKEEAWGHEGGILRKEVMRCKERTFVTYIS